MQLVIGQNGEVYHPEISGSPPLYCEKTLGPPMCKNSLVLAKAGGGRRDLVPWCAQASPGTFCVKKKKKTL